MLTVKDLLLHCNYCRRDELKIFYYEGDFVLYEGPITDEPQIDKETLKNLDRYWSKKNILGEQQVIWWQINEIEDSDLTFPSHRHLQKLIIHCK